MKRVLVVAYIFPPAGGAGVQRTTKFVKYLRDFGWEPVVLTVSNPSIPIYDESLLQDLPSDIKIYKAKTLEPSYKAKLFFAGKGGRTTIFDNIQMMLKNIVSSILIPDIQVLWWPGLFIKMVKVLRKEKIDCVFVTAPPFSTLIITTFVSNLFKKPVIADFRDEWVFYRINTETMADNSFLKLMDRLLERYAVRKCSAYIGVTNGYINEIMKRHPMVSKSKGFVVRNGFDFADFGIRKEDSSVNIKNEVKKSIVYCGTVSEMYSLKNFTYGLKRLFSEKPEYKNRLLVKIFGRVVESEKLYFMDKVIVDSMTIFGYQSHEEIIKDIMNADILLLSQGNMAGAERWIPAKTYEYMATGNHILAIVPDGEIREILLENYPNSTIVNPDDINGIARGIERAFNGIKKVEMSDNILKFERKNLTRELAAVLDKVTG